MRPKKYAAWLAVALLCVGSQVSGQTNDGYVGVYADSAGTTPCITMPQWSMTTLYVIAKLAGASSSGITGAEFRIEVTRPAGWYLVYYAPAGAQALGAPINSGLNLAFPQCRVPTAGRLILGTIGVFNANGDSTSLLVRRHNNPTNPEYLCPLFTLCDAPAFSKVCMTAGQGASCSTLHQKPGRLSEDDPIVFSAWLNDLPDSPASPAQVFTEALSLGTSELWVNGHQASGPQVNCSFDGAAYRVGGVILPLVPETHTLSDSVLMHTFGNVPRVAAALTRGATASDAVAQFNAAAESLVALARIASLTGGADSALAFVNRSPLVAETQRNGPLILFRFHGQLGFQGLNLHPQAQKPVHTRTQASLPRTITDRIKSRLATCGDDGMMILIDRFGDISSYGGQARVEATAQINHLISGGSVSSLPPGPLMPTEPYIQEFVAIAGGQR